MKSVNKEITSLLVILLISQTVALTLAVNGNSAGAQPKNLSFNENLVLNPAKIQLDNVGLQIQFISPSQITPLDNHFFKTSIRQRTYITIEWKVLSNIPIKGYWVSLDGESKLFETGNRYSLVNFQARYDPYIFTISAEDIQGNLGANYTLSIQILTMNGNIPALSNNSDKSNVILIFSIVALFIGLTLVYWLRRNKKKQFKFTPKIENLP